MFTNNPAFELTRTSAFDDDAFDDRRDDFVRQLEIAPERNAGGFEMRAACAGHNYDTGGDIAKQGAAQIRVQDAVDAHLRRQLGVIRADPDRWSWVQCKLMLHQLEAARPFEAPSC
jgi:hypothetical protein